MTPVTRRVKGCSRPGYGCFRKLRPLPGRAPPEPTQLAAIPPVLPGGLPLELPLLRIAAIAAEQLGHRVVEGLDAARGGVELEALAGLKARDRALDREALRSTAGARVELHHRAVRGPAVRHVE